MNDEFVDKKGIRWNLKEMLNDLWQRFELWRATMTDKKELYASGESGLSYDPLEVDEGWESPYRNKNACLEQKLAKEIGEMSDEAEGITPHSPTAAKTHRVPTADEMVTAQPMTAPTRMEVEWRSIQKGDKK